MRSKAWMPTGGGARWFGVVLLGWAAGAAAQPSPEIPWTVQHQQAVRATLRDYDARLRADYAERLQRWRRGFVERRQAALEEAGRELAELAAAIRDRREVSWKVVGEDPQFKRRAGELTGGLIDPAAVRGQLVEWARAVEQQTRREMLRCFRQIIASDLGLHFDQKLRGKVEAAVRAIPVERLVAADATREQLTAAIIGGLPGVVLSDAQKSRIAVAAGELARRGAHWLAVAELQLPPDWADMLAGLAGMLAAKVSARALEWIDRRLTGEPQPEAFADALRRALGDWNQRRLQPKLDSILRAYRYRVLEFVEREAERAAQHVLEGPR